MSAKQADEIRNKIKSVLSIRGKSLAEFAREYRPNEPTAPQNLVNKLSRGSLRLDEFIQMMDLLQYDVLLRDRTNNNNITMIEPK